MSTQRIFFSSTPRIADSWLAHSFLVSCSLTAFSSWNSGKIYDLTLQSSLLTRARTCRSVHVVVTETPCQRDLCVGTFKEVFLGFRQLNFLRIAVSKILGKNRCPRTLVPTCSSSPSWPKILCDWNRSVLQSLRLTILSVCSRCAVATALLEEESFISSFPSPGLPCPMEMPSLSRRKIRPSLHPLYFHFGFGADHGTWSVLHYWVWDVECPYRLLRLRHVLALSRLPQHAMKVFLAVLSHFESRKENSANLVTTSSTSNFLLAQWPTPAAVDAVSIVNNTTLESVRTAWLDKKLWQKFSPRTTCKYFFGNCVVPSTTTDLDIGFSTVSCDGCWSLRALRVAATGRGDSFNTARPLCLDELSLMIIAIASLLLPLSSLAFPKNLVDTNEACDSYALGPTPWSHRTAPSPTGCFGDRRWVLS